MKINIWSLEIYVPFTMVDHTFSNLLCPKNTLINLRLVTFHMNVVMDRSVISKLWETEQIIIAKQHTHNYD